MWTIQLTQSEIKRYAPYHTMPVFLQGHADYRNQALSQDKQGVEAQAYDRGAECAMRRGRLP
jgi:hypothetical protein